MITGYRKSLPRHMIDGVAAWVERGEPHPDQMGSCWRAILCNDLVGFVQHADDNNRRHIVDWTDWLVFVAPSACWGSRARLDEWYRTHHGGE